MTFDQEITDHFEFQLKLLDEAHARARGPRARKRIEIKVAELKRELEDLREEAKVVDIAYARWKRAFDKFCDEKD